MALPGSTDDHPIRITAPEYKPNGQGLLEQWLAKEAEGGIKPEDNEQVSTVNYSDLYDDPKGRKDGSNVDGNWGEGPHMAAGKQEPFHQNNSTYTASQKERQDITSRAFQTKAVAERADQALLSANLEHARTGDFTTHSVLLQSKTKEGAAPSLSERVRSLLNRF